MFSVIIPLYNKAPYVRKAIESVMAQSDTDWELIIVDNSSTDGSFHIAQETVKGDRRIQLFQQPNGGVSAARNNAAAQARGEYLCFLDSDDWWDPGYLEAMRGLIGRHPGAGIYSATYYIVKNGRCRVAPIGLPPHFTEGPIDYCGVYAQTLCMPTNCSVACVPRSLFDTLGGFRSSLTLGEDLDLWLRITATHPIVLLNRPLSYYNQDADPHHRAIKQLHNPAHHVLWNLEQWAEREHNDHTFKQLIDHIRVYSLYPYYLNHRYRNEARQELAKVDWSQQSPKWRRCYHMPIALLRMNEWIRSIAVQTKNLLIRRCK